MLLLLLLLLLLLACYYLLLQPQPGMTLLLFDLSNHSANHLSFSWPLHA